MILKFHDVSWFPNVSNLSNYHVLNLFRMLPTSTHGTDTSPDSPEPRTSLPGKASPLRNRDRKDMEDMKDMKDMADGC